MARQLNITVPLQHTDQLISDIKEKEGLLSLSIQKGSSIKPPGDILVLQVTNSTLHEFMQTMENYHIIRKWNIYNHKSS
jgi:hypothetical protein